ncbi:GSCOCG00008328001-RA-CDS [Cotesia congregata]|nr:GSCOCG00008328001-RA-CDS [Cotesia congregata]
MDKKVQQAITYLLLLIAGATGLQNLKINVPPMARSGDAVSLSCIYDLQGPLYTIKWYFNDNEFYRFVPKALPTQHSYSVNGMKVDIKNSDENGVTLINVSRELTGLYKCEVSEDMPTYHTAMKEQHMQVVDVPDTDPVILVDKSRVEPNEILKANCTSGASHPAPNVTWTLNGAYLNNETMEFKITSRKIPKGNMMMTWSSLELKAASGLFRDSRLGLRCFANIDGIYTATAEYEITEDAPLLAPITGDASPHRGKNGCETTLSGTLEDRWMRILLLIAGALALSKLNR